MNKIIFTVIILLACSFSLAAQQLAIDYTLPLQYEKINNRILADAIIHYRGDKSGISVDLDGKKIEHSITADGKISVRLPLVGDPCEIGIRNHDKLLERQIFHPMIPADWGYFRKGTIDIINSSHQDIAWENTPDSCRDSRIHKIIIPALKMSEENPDFCFGMEQTLNLREILETYPNYKNIIKEANQKKRFSWGATLNQPYEGLLTDEQLIREMYLGRKWILDHFNGAIDTRTAFNMDVPGRSAQFAQVLQKSGVKYLVVSRMKEGFYNWYSPDGSHVLTYSPGNYGWASIFYKYFDEDAPTAMSKLSKVLKNWNEYYASRNIPPHYAVFISNDAAGPKYYKEVIREWNKIVKLADVPIPELRYTTAEDFLTKVDIPGARFDSISGERPNLWLYIHGPAHYEAIKAKRAAGIHLPGAEMFNTIDCLLDNDFSRYPKSAFDAAWYKSIYDDHGWGGKHGEITDSIFDAYLHQANNEGKQLLDNALNSISSKISTSRKNAVIVYNDLSWDRKGVAKLILPGKDHFSVIDGNGKNIPVQNFTRGDSTILLFMADKVPSVGYETYYLSKSKKPISANHTVMDNFCENNYYKIDFGNGGITSLYDKELSKNILNTTRFAGGDVMDLGYTGNGAGEFTTITPTNMYKYDKLSNHVAKWEVTQDGDLLTTYQALYVMNGTQIIQRITVYHQMKKIEFEYDIPDWAGIRSRQLRFALPMNADKASISYDVPMGVSTVGESELKMRPGGWGWYGTYRQKPAEIHPREVQNFVSANSGDMGLTMSSTISVFDWIDPTVDAVSYPVIQAIMLSTHKSCHNLGNWYLQKGAHNFKFAMTSHKPGWKQGYTFGIANNHDFYTILKKDRNKNGKLPSSLSFIKSSSPFTLVTAFKKSDEGDSTLIRFVEMKGESRTTTIEFFKPFKSVDKVNLIETYQKNILEGHTDRIDMNLQHNSVESYKINF